MKKWVSGFLTGVCLMFWFIILVGCATPRTNEEWALKCLEIRDEQKFEQCVQKWDAWSRTQLEGR